VFEAVTEAADRLMGGGEFDIYDKEWGICKRRYDEALSSNVVKSCTYEYKWLSDIEGVKYGPFTAVEMQEWKQAGYFGPGSVASVRIISGPIHEEVWINSNLFSTFI